MFAVPLQPCPACKHPSVRFCEGARQGTALARDERLEWGEAAWPPGEFPLLGEEVEGRRWQPERVLLYHCTTCRYARFSLSGLLRGEPSPFHNLAGGKREGSSRVLVLHHVVRPHDTALRDEEGRAGALGDGQAGQSKEWIASPETRLVQQSISPLVFVSADLPEEESYAPAKWAYFVGGEEVCKDVFQKQLERAYAACLRGRIEST